MEAATAKSNKGVFKTIFARREIVLVAAMVIASIIIGIIEPIFLSRPNIFSMLTSITLDGMISIGMVLCLACGELDLSVGMTMAFSGVLSAIFLTHGVPVVVTIILSMAVALGIGAVNAFLVSVVGLNSFITTLGMSSVAQGLMLVFSNGHSITGLPEGFTNIGQGKVFGIQYPVIILFVIVIIMDILFRNAKVFRKVFYVGSNEKAASLNGINVRKVKTMCFLLCAGFSGLAGILLTARFGSSSVTVGSSTPMNAITACIIGGASLNGGKGSVWGAVLGALLLAMLSTALNLLGVNIYWQNFITGVILIVAILFDVLSERGKAAAK